MPQSITEWVSRFAQLSLGGLMVGLTALIFVNVTLRYGIGYTISWTEEVTKYTLIWIVFIGGGVAAREAGHLSIDMMMALLPERLGQYHIAVVSAISAAICILLGVIGWNAAAMALQFGQKGSASGLPMFWVYLGLPLGCALLALGFFESAYKALQGERRKRCASSFGN